MLPVQVLPGLDESKPGCGVASRGVSRPKGDPHSKFPSLCIQSDSSMEFSLETEMPASHRDFRERPEPRRIVIYFGAFFTFPRSSRPAVKRHTCVIGVMAFQGSNSESSASWETFAVCVVAWTTARVERILSASDPFLEKGFCYRYWRRHSAFADLG